MTDEKRLEAAWAALRAYKQEAESKPEGARERLLETGIWTKEGKLRREYGGEPKASAAA